VSAGPPELLFSRCVECHTVFQPRRGPCPRCGARDVTPVRLPSEGVVIGSTELIHPPAGWQAPHRLALVELAESTRALVIVRGTLPGIGARVWVVHEGENFVVEGGPSTGA
jgi:uncharacterized OB-fold protein